MRTTGIVKWFNDAKGFGFVTTDAGKDAFIHYTEIDKGGPAGFKSLGEGDRVEFDMHQGPKGPAAENLVVIEKNPSPSAPSRR